MAEFLDVLRTEKKYPVSGAVYYGLHRRLMGVLKLDGHCVSDGGYLVRSLYFDSFFNKDYYEKKDGVECRGKIRLRTYGGEGPVKLEWKQKRGSQQRKRSLILEKEDAMELTEGRLRCLMNYDSPLAMEIYAYMVSQAYNPRCVVQYRRAAFVAAMNDTRVTLDSELRAHEGSFDLFSPDPPLYPVGPIGGATLEIKYNQFLPSYVKETVSAFQLTEQACSKYCAARRYGLGGNLL